MKRLLVVAGLVVGMTAATACSGDDDDDAGTSCDDKFAVGAVLSQEDAEAGCELSDGTTVTPTVSECVDGRMLITYDDADPQIWGMVDEPLQAAESGVNAEDPDYVEMLDRC